MSLAQSPQRMKSRARWPIHALAYLWLRLLKRRLLQSARGLRRPTTLIGAVGVTSLVGCLFYYRHEEIFAQVVRPESLAGGALVMLCGSLFKGFLQRGLAFAPPDIEFIFTSPFTQRQVVCYRLMPSYLYALAQGIVFAALFQPHLHRPVLAGACLVLFQLVCFHVATAAAIWAGTLSDAVHHRIRCMMLGAFFVEGALYLRVAWEIKLVPAAAAAPLAQLLFYPAVSLSDTANAPALHHWAASMARGGGLGGGRFWEPALYLAGFAAATVLSLWWLLRLKANIFEASLATTVAVTERRHRLRQGRAVDAGPSRARSARLPRLALFQGSGAIVWKNLLAARRSRRELLVAFVFTAIYTCMLTALLWKFNQIRTEALKDPRLGPGIAEDVVRVSRTFCAGVILFLGALAFFLQRMFPFDFRRDARHAAGFRTLPAHPFALVLAEVSVPAGLVLLCQVVGLVPLFFYGWSQWPLILLLASGFPAVALALNSVWNLHHLLAASRCAGGPPESASAVGTLMVVALSFLVFFPAAWTFGKLDPHFPTGGHVFLAAGIGIGIQYLVDLALLLVLARLFQRFEAGREG